MTFNFLKRLFSLSTTRALQYYQLMRQGSVILVSVILAKSQLTTEEIGLYEMLFYIGTVLSFFWVNGLLQGMTPVYSNLKAEERTDFFFNNFLVFGALGALLCGVLYVGAPWIVPTLTGQESLPFFGLYCLYLLFHLPAFPVEYIYLLRKKPRAIVLWGMASFGLYLLAIGLPLLLGYGLEWSFKALIVLATGRFLWAVVLVLRSGRVQWNPGLVVRYLSFSGPLMANILVGNLILLFDAWLVGWWYRDEAVFAIFRYGARELPLAQALAGGLGVAIIPRLTEDWEAGLAELKAMTRRLFHLLFPLTAVLILLSPWFFPWVFNPDFADSAIIFQIYLMLTFSRLLFPNSLLLAKGEPKVIFRVGLLELAVKVVFGFICIYYGGLVGLAWSAVIAFMTEKAGLIIYLRYRHQVRLSQWIPWQLYSFYLFAVLGVYFLSQLVF